MDGKVLKKILNCIRDETFISYFTSAFVYYKLKLSFSTNYDILIDTYLLFMVLGFIRFRAY